MGSLSFIHILLYSIVFNIVVHVATSSSPPPPIQLEDKIQESFDGLSSIEGTTKQPFIQGKTVYGWWSNQDSYLVSDGTANEGGLYAYGGAGNKDRSLGAVTSAKTKIVNFGISLASSKHVAQVKIVLNGEQWRYGGAMPDTNALIADYSVMTSAQYSNGGWGAHGDDTLWTVVPQLTVNGSSDAGATRPIFEKKLSTTINLQEMGPGKVLQLRWSYKNGHDGLSIDDFEIAPVYATNGGEIATTVANTTIGKWWRTVAIVSLGLMALAIIPAIVFFVKWRTARRQLVGYDIPANQEQPSLPAVQGRFWDRFTMRDDVERQPLSSATYAAS